MGTEKRLELVRMDTDKATEESKESLGKIRRRFFDDILFPKLIVKGIRLSKQELSSFRIGRHQQINLDINIDADQRKKFMKMMEETTGETEEGRQSDSGTDEDDKEETTGLLTQSDDMSNSTLIPTRKQTNATNLDGKIIKSLKKQEEKRDKRAARKKEWQELVA